MAIVGYRRVSTLDQNLDRQDLGEVDKVFEEKLSGKSAKDRPALQAMIEYVREGDSVVVYSIDRLARDLRDLQEIIQRLNDLSQPGDVIAVLSNGGFGGIHGRLLAELGQEAGQSV